MNCKALWSISGVKKPEHEDLTVIVTTWNAKLRGEAELFDKTKPIDRCLC